jgi:hypothetical protein
MLSSGSIAACGEPKIPVRNEAKNKVLRQAPSASRHVGVYNPGNWFAAETVTQFSKLTVLNEHDARYIHLVFRQHL